eukprot:TRINITY_DN80172_c0_g1_i1.p1 TRINITY_DN80172_c0_g1~~TRINITY_DN80172_c0_g1_i1.p1  ORF type:complete len:244 (-),score=51.09 TRINITY_DN80172_c0_g1_i1:293-1024(-)
MQFFLLALLPAVALGQLAGGVTDTTVAGDYEPVQFAVKAINQHLTTSTGGLTHDLSLVEVVHAKTQVVAGQKLYLTLHLTGDYFCDVNVWYRSWLQGQERLIITDGPTCTQRHGHASARVGGRTGGVSQAKPLPNSGDHANAHVLDAMNFAACHMNDRINFMFSSVVGDSSGVTYTQQLTAGMTYRFSNVPMVSTHCRNQGCDGLDLTACPANVHGQTLTCQFAVQYQAWMPTKFTLIDVTCQ